MYSIFEQMEAMRKKNEQDDVKVKEIIKELIDTGWSKDNASQMKAVQLLKGLALSKDPKAAAFMRKLDDFTTKLKMDLE